MKDSELHRYIVIADLHGDWASYRAVSDISSSSGARILIAGDIAARYSRPLAKALAADAGRITAVGGNGDTYEDRQLLSFRLPVSQRIPFAGRTIFLTHGNHYTPLHRPQLSPGDIFISAHTHMPALELEAESGVYTMNPGSVFSPRGSSAPSYGIITPGNLEIRELHTGRVIASCRLEKPIR